MQIYLPIAKVSVDAFLLLGLGGLVGVLSGMLGVGGGFLLTPMLFFIGIPPAVAVATGANRIVASSCSGVLAHLRRKTVDIKMGIVLQIGGLIGAQTGTPIGVKMKAEQLRVLLAMTVPAVCIKLGFDLLLEPRELYSLGAGGH